MRQRQALRKEHEINNLSRKKSRASPSLQTQGKSFLKIYQNLACQKLCEQITLKIGREGPAKKVNQKFSHLLNAVKKYSYLVYS